MVNSQLQGCTVHSTANGLPSLRLHARLALQSYGLTFQFHKCLNSGYLKTRSASPYSCRVGRLHLQCRLGVMNSVSQPARWWQKGPAHIPRMPAALRSSVISCGCCGPAQTFQSTRHLTSNIPAKLTDRHVTQSKGAGRRPYLFEECLGL